MDAIENQQDGIAATARDKAACRSANGAGNLDLGAQAVADSRGQDRARRDPLLVACTTLRPSRWLLGIDQRHYRDAVERGLDRACVARSHPGHNHRSYFWLLVFAVRYASVELHPR